MQIKIIDDLTSIPAEQWNALAGVADNPFLRHEFLAGLERYGCVGESWGWLPRHIVIEDDAGRLLGALPLYEKHNSYGELVFDWSWADAHQRSGLRYYPKLVSAVPYTPATGPRLLTLPGAPVALADTLVQTALELARESGASSLHILFPDRDDVERLQAQRLVRRTGTQFHWHNRGYRDFDDFLATFTSKRRKNVKRERRRVVEAGIELEILDGHQADEAIWEQFHRFYRNTFEMRGGYATLSLEFFRHLGRTMPESIMLVLARYQGRYVAGALSLRGRDTLYGRHWGCEAEFDSLHFEACYYAGIDYCIAHGLKHFEPGAQGEHKVGRGFEPTPTWSAHWLSNPALFEAVDRFCAHEHTLMEEYMAELAQQLPFRDDEEANG